MVLLPGHEGSKIQFLLHKHTQIINAFLTDSRIVHSVHDKITKSVGDTVSRRTAQTGCKVVECNKSVVFTVDALVRGARRVALSRALVAHSAGALTRSPPPPHSHSDSELAQQASFASLPCVRAVATFTTRSIQALPVQQCFFCYDDAFKYRAIKIET